MRSPMLSLLSGLAALFLAASWFGHALYLPGEYRRLPWAHLGGAALLAAASVAITRAGRGAGQGWTRRATAWIGSVVGVACAATLWLFVFVGARLPDAPPPPLRAPDVALADQEGNIVRLADLRARGPVVVAFYRGGFDRWGHAALSDLERVRPRIEDVGGRVVAIGGDPIGEARALHRRLGLRYPLLSDLDLEATRRFGLVDADGAAPHPAVLVVAPDGAVAWAHVFRSARDLPDPERIVSETARW